MEMSLSLQTRYWQLDKSKLNIDILKEAAALMQKDGLVAFPTETVYGLGANGLSAKAVEKIFLAKGRPSDNPLILHIDKKELLNKLSSEVPETAQKLIEKFWPGPLTLVVKKANNIPDVVTAGLATVAVRMPNHPVALRLIELAGMPIAAPSANLSGKPSPTTAQAVQEDLDGKIEAIIDAGSTNVGLESTVVDCSCEVPEILRPGGITEEQIVEVVGKVNRDYDLTAEKPKAPGMKYRHYAPNAPLYIIDFVVSDEFLLKKIHLLQKAQKRVGVLADAGTVAKLPKGVLSCGNWQTADDYGYVATNLYSWLREFDSHKVEIIFARGVKEDGLGKAIMNRLKKAAGLKIINSEKELDSFLT